VELSGLSFIAGKRGEGRGAKFAARHAKTGADLNPLYTSSTAQELESALAAATEAFQIFGKSPATRRASLLRAIAVVLEQIASHLVARAMQETGLPEARLQGEVGRTCGQLRLFASVLDEGSWQNARIDTALPERKPLPRPYIRSMLVPLGPVAVFGASNFPLAFSVAGGDTASALAAGNPVVVKAHSAHPGTSELVAAVINDAIAQNAWTPASFRCCTTMAFRSVKR